MIIYVDEVGCASIFSSVLTCAVAIRDNESPVQGVRDSKKLTRQKREALFTLLQKYEHAYGSASSKRIEEINIYWAKFEAMKKAVEKLLKRGIKPEKVIVDGNVKIPNLDIPQEAIIKADDKLWQVGVSSILAKVKRDSAMAELAKIEKYSYYSLESNAGYYSPAHFRGIVKYGPTVLHRRKFSYFKYCMFHHNEYQKVKDKMSVDDYIAMIDEEARKKKVSAFVSWRDNKPDLWKEIPYGGKE